jgi:hypothetical protein
MTSRIGQHVTHVHDDTVRVGQVVALVRGRPERVIVCWSTHHDHDEAHGAECTVEYVDQLTPRTPAVRS